ncbi:MAG: MFS family permease [Bacillariaceae sp.]|jgi:MFS family permease
MIGLNAVFGFTAAFLNSYINGQVVPVALNDPDSKYIGLLSSVVPMVAAAMSLLFGRISIHIGKGPILIFGALCFGGVVLPFIVQPDAAKYGWATLIAVYSLHGTGRATFEGTLRATFADYFSYEKEGAFANIILQNGISSGVGYIRKFARLLYCCILLFVVSYYYSIFFVSVDVLVINFLLTCHY